MICDVTFRIRAVETSDLEQLGYSCAHLKEIIDAALSMTPRETVDGYDCTYFQIEKVKQ